ncbi:hypothetical protein [Microbacterium oleivorans]|uniref:hypothetical protein n=1 Tax=Microbacterium oleivorans TaxID=273677 RepID=UPI00080EDF59|nr:hypothetical protein [Microbacterium oleivorans]
MTNTFHINGKDVDVTDVAAVQALTPDEYRELLELALQDQAPSGDAIVGLHQEQPPAGTGFIIANPPADSDRDG